MKRFMPFLLVGMGFWSGAAVAQTFITLDYPNGFQTQLNGIDGNNIVGNDNTLPGGFLYNGSTYTGIVDPLVNTSTLGAGTWPNAISGSNIVGCYSLGTIYHGFLYNGSTYTTIDDPLANTGSYLDWGTVPIGVSGNNVVGYYGTLYPVTGGYDTAFHAFLYNGSTWTTIDDPLVGSYNYDFEGTVARGIQGNEVVGSYRDSSDHDHGFIYNILTKTFTTLDDPLASGSWGTDINAISGNNIVGEYDVSTGTNDEMAVHGFLYNGSTYTTIDDPLGVDTYIDGISGNTIVGWYGVPGDGGEDSHGFVATIPEPSTLALLAVGVLAFAVYAWRKRSLALATKSTLPSENDSHDAPVILSIPSPWTQSTRGRVIVAERPPVIRR